MRIGLIAPPWVPVPPPAYGGTEVVLDNLARGLQELGHEVRLFTVGESQCPVPTDFLYPKAVAPIGMTVQESAHVLAAYEALADMDLIHDHTFLGPLIAGMKGLRRPPVVTTNHGPFSDETRPIYVEIARHASIVAISHSQARAANGVPVADVIHHGIDLKVHTPGAGGGGYLMFVGRMSADKGVHHAVRVAKKAGRRLVLATKMRESPRSTTSTRRSARCWIQATICRSRCHSAAGSRSCAAPPRCSTRSPGASPLAWSWRRHWPPGHRSWPSPMARLRRSLIQAGPGISAVTKGR